MFGKIQEVEAPRERRDHLARARREMEAALILEEAPFESADKDQDEFNTYVLQWLETRTVAFHKVFNDLFEEKVDIVSEWRSNREKVLSEIRSRMDKY